MIGMTSNAATRMPYASGNVKIICEGNSLMMGYGKETGVAPAQALSVAQHLAAMPFFSATSIVNLAVGGSTWQDNLSMSSTSRLNALQAAYEPGKQHVLLLWEDTNASFNNATYTGVQIAQQVTAYIALAKARVPGAKIVVLTTIPRYGFSGEWTGNHVGGNQVLDACDAYRKANWKALGIDALVDLRRTGKFITSGTEYMSVPMKPYQMDNCHLNGNGYGLTADLCVGPLRSLTTR